MPIPGDADNGNQDKDGGDYVLPSYMRNTFPLLCRFWSTAQEVSILLHEADCAGNTLADFIPISRVEAVYHKLLAWAEGLHKNVRLYDSSPGHLIIC